MSDAGLLHHLDDLAGERADVGAAVAADFGLVAHAAERQAHELAVHRARDRLGQRGLADARRADEGEDRRLRLLDQRAHREELEDALLDLLEPVVVFVEDLLGVLEVAALLGLLVPRHRDQPVEIVARDGGLGRHRRHRLEPLQLLDGLFLDVLRHPRLLDLLLQLFDLVALLVLAAQFLLDRLHLLVEVVLLLRLLHLLLHARLDAAIDLELVDLGFEDAGDAVEALERRDDLEQVLLLVDADEQVRGNGVGELARIVHAARRRSSRRSAGCSRASRTARTATTTWLIVCSTSPAVSFCRCSTLTTTRWKPLSSFHSMTRARSTPSTSTLMLPSGSFRLCTTLATQPIV